MHSPVHAKTFLQHNSLLWHLTGMVIYSNNTIQGDWKSVLSLRICNFFNVKIKATVIDISFGSFWYRGGVIIRRQCDIDLFIFKRAEVKFG